MGCCSQQLIVTTFSQFQTCGQAVLLLFFASATLRLTLLLMHVEGSFDYRKKNI